MIKGINKYSFVFLLSSFILLQSCKSRIVYTDSRVMKEKTWELENVATFKVPITDTVVSNSVYFTIRTASSYPFRNIYLFVTTISPDGRSITDTLQYNLADEKGKWYGKGFGDIHELNLPYKTNIFFPLKGIYMFNVRHGMRIENLKGVYDLGLRIEKISK
jgi:gliding motility-associated lipoprotein GldH